MHWRRLSRRPIHGHRSLSRLQFSRQQWHCLRCLPPRLAVIPYLATRIGSTLVPQRHLQVTTLDNGYTSKKELITRALLRLTQSSVLVRADYPPLPLLPGKYHL